MNKKDLSPEEQELLKIEQENIRSGNEITGSDGRTREVDDKLIGDDKDIKDATERADKNSANRSGIADNNY